MDDIQRAIEDLKKMLEYPRFKEVHGEYYENAISGLEELQKYRQIGGLVHMKVYKAIAEKITSDMRADLKNLDELTEYRSIGTPEECREAVGRQKKIMPRSMSADYGQYIGRCTCGRTVFDCMNYCDNCGQKLDWEKGENDEQINTDR